LRLLLRSDRIRAVYFIFRQIKLTYAYPHKLFRFYLLKSQSLSQLLSRYILQHVFLLSNLFLASFLVSG
jgi:hypothetical protein